MNDRRQFTQGFLSAMASLYFPSTSYSANRFNQSHERTSICANSNRFDECLNELRWNVKVIGVGNTGRNAVEYMSTSGVNGEVEFFCIDTDIQSFKSDQVHKISQLGNTCFGMARKTDFTSFAASDSEEALRFIISDALLVIIIAGLDVGTATSITPVIARLAKDMGRLTVAVVTTPFEFKGPRCLNIGNVGLAALKPYVASLLVIPNKRLQRSLGDDVTMEGRSIHTNNSVKNIVSALAGTLTTDGHVGVDIIDVEALLTHIRDLLATLGVGLTSQYLEQFGRKLLGGLLGQLAGGMGKSLGRATASVTFSFATTYALGQVAKRYYGGGRQMSTALLQETFQNLIQPAKDLQAQYLPQIRQKANSLDMRQIMALVQGR